MIRLHAHTTTLDLSLELEEGCLLAVYGPSGAGKTTLLRMLAGLTSPGRKGRIEVNGEVWEEPSRNIHVPPQRRQVGMVFQDYALFPHLTVRENLAVALPKGDCATPLDGAARVDALLDVLDLHPLRDRKSGRLSGGQQQRVALARALARRPRLLLLDEPLSAQDGKTRARLGAYLLDIHRQEKLTTVLVSHSLPEVRRLADQVVCLENGRIASLGGPGTVFGHAQDVY